MSPAEKFSELVTKRIAPALKAHNYTRRGLTFFSARTQAITLINFQKSVKSTPQSILFTVNIGVASRRLLQFFSGTEVVSNLTVDDCHWKQRLTSLLPQHAEWWSIDDQTSIDSLGRQICEYFVTLAIPLINLYSHDEELRDLWTSNGSPGLTNFQRLVYLSVLVKCFGTESELQAVEKELLRITEGKPSATVAMAHLRRVRQES